MSTNYNERFIVIFPYKFNHRIKYIYLKYMYLISALELNMHDYFMKKMYVIQ